MYFVSLFTVLRAAYFLLIVLLLREGLCGLVIFWALSS